MTNVTFVNQTSVRKLYAYPIAELKIRDESFMLYRSKHLDKVDIYDLGVILLEIITGKPIKCIGEAAKMQNQVKVRRNILVVFMLS